MPLLGSLLGGLFVLIADLFGKFVVKKVAYGGSLILIATASFVAFYLVAAGAIALLITTVPNIPYLQTGLWLAIPDTFPAMVSTVTSAEVAYLLWRWHKSNINTVK